MTFRIARLLASSVVVLTTATGCLPATSPTGTPSPHPSFTNADQAFAAAEKTYRAYVDAVNHRRATPNSRPDPDSFLHGQALLDDAETRAQLAERGLRIEGETVVGRVKKHSAVFEGMAVGMLVCLDSARTSVMSTDNRDLTPSDRPSKVALEVGMMEVDGALLIATSRGTSEFAC